MQKSRDMPASCMPSACPVKHTSDNQDYTSTLSRLNPLNYMPTLSQSQALNQPFALPVTREPSTIPRGDADSNWEYPSPQQMYNAMLRKGYDDTPIDAVESMVAVHNFLNEGAWAEIIGWERRFSRGLRKGWIYCRHGEESFEQVAADDREYVPEPRLVRFQGRPSEMTPKAKILQALGQIYPSAFGYELTLFWEEASMLIHNSGEPPFDRHDWFIQRQSFGGQKQEIRYVIDYYSAPPEPTGEPVFYLDVRPAIDSPSAAAARLMRWSGDIWWRASGAEVRAAGS